MRVGRKISQKLINVLHVYSVPQSTLNVQLHIDLHLAESCLLSKSAPDLDPRPIHVWLIVRCGWFATQAQKNTKAFPAGRIGKGVVTALLLPSQVRTPPGQKVESLTHAFGNL